ncbi:MAG: hypothetical protein JXR77_01610 [Lentisphaeria bacterium]|nr:hypothetical protein [Lentisphaeria bacterium]
MKRHPFNMVEVLLALGVVAIGVVSVLALFPVGLSSSRDAMAESYAATSAEHLLHSLRWTLHQDWDGWVISNPNWNARPDASMLGLDTSITGAGEFNSAGAIQMQTDKRVYKLVAFADGDDGDDFDGPPTENPDFQCVAAVWGQSIQVSSSTTVDPSIGTRINVEVSWPGELPYTARYKRIYSLEVFHAAN